MSEPRAITNSVVTHAPTQIDAVRPTSLPSTSAVPGARISTPSAPTSVAGSTSVATECGGDGADGSRRSAIRGEADADGVPRKLPSRGAERKDGGRVASRPSQTPLPAKESAKVYDKAAESRKRECRRQRAWDQRVQKYRQSSADTVRKLPLGSVRDALTRAPGAVVFCFAASRDTIEAVIREARARVPDVRVFDPVVGSDIHLIGGRYGELGGSRLSQHLKSSRDAGATATTDATVPTTAPRLICLPYAYPNIFSFNRHTRAPSFVSPIKAFSPTARAAAVTSVIFTAPCPFGDAMPYVAVREYSDTLAHFARDAGELAEICGALAPNEALELDHSRDRTGPALRKLRLPVTTPTKSDVRSGSGGGDGNFALSDDDDHDEGEDEEEGGNRL